MNPNDLSRRLLLTSEICMQLQLYATEITRDNCSRAYLESYAGRTLKRAAELYALSRPEAFTREEQAQPVTPQPSGAEVSLRIVKPDVPMSYDGEPA